MKALFQNQNKLRPQPAIFREGLRQLRLPGIVFTILCVILSIINLDNFNYYYDYVKIYTMNGLPELAFDELVDALDVVSAVFVFGALLYVSQFLRSGKARDFYCATPHSTGTLWLNLAAAAYIWTLIGLSAAWLLQTLVVMIFYDAKLIGICLLGYLGNAAFALMIFAIAALAVTLTGRIINVFATALGLALTPSFLWTAFHASLFTYFRDFQFIRYSHDFTCPDPLARFAYFLSDIPIFGYYEYSIPDGLALFGTGRTIAYCLIMSVLYLAVTCLFASVRTGDTAGRPFINRAAHIVSLVTAALPMACFCTSVASNFLNAHISNYANLVWEYLFMALMGLVIFLAVYWVWELLLTFDVKHSHRAYKYLPVPVLVAVLLTATGYLYHAAEFTTTVKAEQVESFVLVRNSSLNDDLAIFRLGDTYGRTVTEDYQFTDREIINYVSGKINSFVKLYEENPKKAYQSFSGDYEYYDEDGLYYQVDGESDGVINIKLVLKNGREITRAIQFDQEHMEKLAAAIKNDKDYMAKFLALPDSAKLNIAPKWEGLSAGQVEELYNCFVEEYNALTDEQKLEYLKSSLYADYESYEDDDAYVNDGIPYDAHRQVSGSDIMLMSTSGRAGDFVIENCSYGAAASLDGQFSSWLQIEGYAEGRLYQGNYYFNETLEFDTARFPKTAALCVKLHNSDIPDLLDTVEHAKGHLRYLWLTADYFGTENTVGLEYDLVLRGERADLVYWDPEHYDEETNQYREYDVEVVKVDSNAMVAKLLSDAAATGDTVDFTKPYCILQVYSSYYDNVKTFFIQTKLEY